MGIYQDLTNNLGNKDTRKVGNNTYLERRTAKTIALRLHDTDVLTFTLSGSVVLSSGGWKTVTTKARMNDYLPRGWKVGSDRGAWGLYNCGKYVADYQDGITITRFDNVRGAPSKTATNKLQSLRKQIGEYARDYTAKLKAGELSPPNGGDCWYCLMFDSGIAPGGRSANATHLTEHVQENYFVPSLVFNALAAMGDGGIRRQGVLDIMQGGPKSFTQDIALQDTPRAIRRYILKSCGMAA
jgi:hypothetical protein